MEITEIILKKFKDWNKDLERYIKLNEKQNIRFKELIEDNNKSIKELEDELQCQNKN